jgi:hypothetical protein
LGLLGFDPNLYRYVFNAPVLFVDPTGTQVSGGCELGSALQQRADLLANLPGSEEGYRQWEQQMITTGERVRKSSLKYAGELFENWWTSLVVDLASIGAGIKGALLGNGFNIVTTGIVVGEPACGADPPPKQDPPPNPRQPTPQTLPGPTTTNITVWASDPNRMTGPAGFGSLGFIPNETLLSYRIDFENETNATAPAQEVVVTGPLTTNLNWATFQLTELGWGDQLIILPPNTQHFETNVPVSVNGTSFEVQIEAGIHLNSGQAYAVFRSIDPATGLPPSVDAGFLPPEDGTGRGQGHVSYIIRSKPNLPTGTEIRNVALISFDHQPAIATNQRDPHDPSQGTDPAKEALNTIDADLPTSAVASLLPVQTNCSFSVCWAGTDVGSGVTSYDIYVLTNGGPRTLWLAGTTNTCATFSAQGGNAYAFYSIARDGAGNTEAAPPVADAVTTVATGCVSDVRLTIDHSALPEGQGERITLSYPVLPGRNYTVESRDSLDEGVSWQPLPGAPHNTGIVIETNILSQRFYRVRVNQ